MNIFRGNRDPQPTPGGTHLHALVLEHLKAYQDSELPWWRQRLVSGHLSRCSECRKEITQLKRVSEEMRNLPGAMPRPELRARIMASLPDALPQRERATINMPGAARRLSVAGAMCCLLLLGVWALGRNRNAANATRPMSGAQPAGISAVPTQSMAALDRGATRGPVVSTESDHYVDNLAPGTTSSNPTSSNPTSSNPTSNNPTSITPTDLVSRPDQERYTDPTSIEANRIMEQKDVVDDIQRKIKLARRDTERRQILADAAAAQARLALQNSSQTSLQLAVADVAAAQDRLRTVVRDLGGILTETGPRGSTGVTTANDALHQAGDSLDATNTVAAAPLKVMSIRVPVAAVNRLQSSLHEMGTVAQWRTTDNRPGPEAGKTSVMTARSIPKNQSVVPPVAPYGDYRRDRVSLKMQEYAPNQLSKGANRDSITFMICLKAAGNAGH